MIKVSIIVPVYNSEKYLKKCLNSLVNQTLKDIEIIIIDDGSTDNSKKIINSFKDSRINYFYQTNKGQANARNNGLKKVNGKYVMFIDSDDYVDINMCNELFSLANSHDYDIVVTDYYIESKNNTVDYVKILDNNNSKEITHREYMFSDNGPCNKIYKAKFLLDNKFKFPEGIIFEDYASIPTLSIYKPRCYYLNSAFLHYVHHNNSTMRTDEYKEKYENLFEATNILYNKMKDSDCIQELEYLITYHFLYLGSLNFYKYEKYNQLDKISDFMKEKFPKYRKNKYYNKFSFKEKNLMFLFYKKKYNIIKLVQKIKR